MYQGTARKSQSVLNFSSQSRNGTDLVNEMTSQRHVRLRIDDETLNPSIVIAGDVTSDAPFIPASNTTVVLNETANPDLENINIIRLHRFRDKQDR